MNQYLGKLAREYSRYLVIQYFISLGNFPTYTSWLEKLLTTMATINMSSKSSDQVFCLTDPLIESEFVYLESMTTKDEYKFIKKEIHNKIKSFTDLSKHDTPQYSITEESNNGKHYLVTCGTFSKRLSVQRIAALKDMLDDKHKKHFTELLIICCLRYECIISSITQWSMPLQYYKYIYNNCNTRFEAFASPFNCQLMLISKNIGYGSMFYDTDKYFGSLGDALHIDYSKLPSLYSSNNKLLSVSMVPMEDSKILRSTFKLLYNNLDTKNILFIVATNKLDNKYYPKIILSNGLLYERLLYAGEYYFENLTLDENPVWFNWYKQISILFIGNSKYFNRSFLSIKDSFDNKVVNKESSHYVKKLKKEYNRYMLVLEMKKLSNGHEWANIYERFLITMGNIKKEEGTSHDYLFSDVPTTHEVYTIMKYEMGQKKISNIDGIIETIHNKIKGFLSTDFSNTTLKYHQLGNEFVCLDVRITINFTRRMALINRLSKIGKSKYFVELMLILWLRYNCLSLGGQQWNLPFKTYSYFNSAYGLNLECFASPLNSQLVIANKNARFCSLFYDTDKYFGSYGNLFEANIEDISRELNGSITMTLFPPNIEDLIYKMIDLVNHWLSVVPKLRVITGLLKWTDFPPHELLEKHKALKYIREYKIGEYYFENSLSTDVPKILKPGKNPYIMYVLANFELGKDEPPYETIDDYMRSY